MRLVPRGRHSGWLPGRLARHPGSAQAESCPAVLQPPAGTKGGTLHARPLCGIHTGPCGVLGPVAVGRAPASGPQNAERAGLGSPFARRTESISAGPEVRAWHTAARDKGHPSGPLTPSLRPLLVGGCPCSCLPSSAAPSPRGGCVNPWQVPRQRSLALSQPALHPDLRFPGLLTAGAHHPEAGSGACPMSRWCPPPPGSASAVRETLNLAKPSGAAGRRVSAREVCPPRGAAPDRLETPEGPRKAAGGRPARGLEKQGVGGPRSEVHREEHTGARGMRPQWTLCGWFEPSLHLAVRGLLLKQCPHTCRCQGQGPGGLMGNHLG